MSNTNDVAKYAVVKRNALETGGAVFNVVEAYLLYTQFKAASGLAYSEWKARFTAIEGFESLASSIQDTIHNSRSKKHLLEWMYKAIENAFPQINISEVAKGGMSLNRRVSIYDINKLLQLRAHISEATTGLLGKSVDGVEVEASLGLEGNKAEYYLQNESIERNEHLSTDFLVYKDPTLTNTYIVVDPDMPVRIYIRVNKGARWLDGERKDKSDYYISAYVQLQDGNVRVVRIGNAVYNTDRHLFDFNIMQNQLFTDVKNIGDIVALIVASKSWADIRELALIGNFNTISDVYTIDDIKDGVLVG